MSHIWPLLLFSIGPTSSLVQHTYNWAMTGTMTKNISSLYMQSCIQYQHMCVSAKVSLDTIYTLLEFKQLRYTMHVEWTAHYHQLILSSLTSRKNVNPGMVARTLKLYMLLPLSTTKVQLSPYNLTSIHNMGQYGPNPNWSGCHRMNVDKTLIEWLWYTYFKKLHGS